MQVHRKSLKPARSETAADPVGHAAPADTAVEQAALVIGGTGILRPAVLRLLKLGKAVVVVGRDPYRFASLRAAATGRAGRMVELTVDATSAGFVELLDESHVRRGLRPEFVLAYSPATTADALSEIMVRWNPTLVEVLTSRFAKPANAGQLWSVADLPRPPDNRRRLVLGWQMTAGKTTWHTPEQISDAALLGLDAPGDRVLGLTSPWSDRP